MKEKTEMIDSKRGRGFFQLCLKRGDEPFVVSCTPQANVDPWESVASLPTQTIRTALTEA
jgi:hypothetical protein